MLAYVTAPGGVRAILAHLGLPTQAPTLAEGEDFSPS
ncbi:ATP-dependent helicase HrpA [Archangium violaceum]